MMMIRMTIPGRTIVVPSGRVARALSGIGFSLVVSWGTTSLPHERRSSTSCRGASAVGPIEEALAEQLGHGGEAKAARPQGVDDVRQRRQRAAAIAAAVVHDDDRAGPGGSHDPAVDGPAAGVRPIAGIHVPGDGPHPEAGGRVDDGRVDSPSRRPEETWREVSARLDQRTGRRDFRVARKEGVMHRVVADLTALSENPAHHRGAAGDLLADLEEGGVRVLLAQDIEEARGVVAGPVVEGEGEGRAVPRPVGVEHGPAPGTADNAHRAQAKDAPGPSRQCLEAAATALDHAPVIAMRPQTGVVRDQGEHELARVRPPDAGGDHVTVLDAATGVGQLQADRAVGPSASEAEAAGAVPTVAAELEANEI